jgi:hypothetical protein
VRNGAQALAIQLASAPRECLQVRAGERVAQDCRTRPSSLLSGSSETPGRLRSRQVIVGLNRNSPDTTVRLNLEYEIY